MKMPDKKKAYCPKCKTSTEHKLKMYKKGKTRSTSRGQARHERKLTGYTSKVAGKVTVYKQAKHQTLMMECTKCGYKHPKTIGPRTKKVLELTKK